MKKITYPLLALLTLGQMKSAVAQEESRELGPLVAEWMKLMQERQKVEEKWRENKQILESTSEGLNAEIAELNEDIEGVKANATRFEKDIQEQSAERDRYTGAKKWLTDQLPGYESRALSLKNRFPESLLKGNVKLASAFEALANRSGNEDTVKEGMSNRLNRVILILNAANKFSQTLKVVQEKRQHEGKDVQLTVMYLGFSQAYATNEGRTAALHGVCSADGWKFETATQDADKIWEAIQMAKGEADVDFVSLPVSGK